MTAVDLCHKAHARKLAMFHLEPIFDDVTIERHQEGTARYEELTRDDAPRSRFCVLMMGWRLRSK